MIDVTGSETTVSQAINQSNEAQPIADTQERDCMRCEQTFTTQPNAPVAEAPKPRKWQTQAGPRQSKQVQEAIRALSWEGRTYTELSGVIGGEEHRHSYSMVFGGQREDSIGALDVVAEKFNYMVTRENYQAIIAECQAQLAVLVANRPVTDKRETPEQRAETIRKNEEYRAKQEALAAERRAEQEAIEAERKAQAEALRASEPVSSVSGSEVRYNKGHDGVEISFPSKPDRAVIDSCKRHGFRWGMRNKVWYKKFSAEAWKTACRIAGVDELPAPASVNCDPSKNAGCDRCGVNDRAAGLPICEDCASSNPDAAYVQAQEAYEEQLSLVGVRKGQWVAV